MICSSHKWLRYLPLTTVLPDDCLQLGSSGTVPVPTYYGIREEKKNFVTQNLTLKRTVKL